MPDTSATGAASTRGQGVATTSTARARTALPGMSHAVPATTTVTGTNTRRVPVGQTHERCPLRRRRRHHATIPRSALCSARGPGAHPEGATGVDRAALHQLAGSTDRGEGSPVGADSSTVAGSPSTAPSTGTTSPGRTSSVARASPTGTVARPSATRCATVGAADISADAPSAPAARTARASPVVTIRAMIAPASCSPRAGAPRGSRTTTSTPTRPQRKCLAFRPTR